VRQLLERIYGTCYPNYSFPWSAQARAYKGTPLFNTLQRVLGALTAYRGYSDFIRSEQLPPCDFFVPDPGFLVEFDESQHFTVPRKIALSLYPPDSNVGFSIDRWISLCDEYNARDNNPPYRDEQRAWYDTLRDLVPSVHGFHPTVRLYANDICWCSLDPLRTEDMEMFKSKLTPCPKLSVQCGNTEKTSKGTIRLGVVFPPLWSDSSILGRPANTPTSRKPDIPSVDQFGNRPLDLIVFPEAYIQANDAQRHTQLASLARALQTHLLVGAHEDYLGRPDYRKKRYRDQGWQILLLFNPDGSCKKVYTKHSTAGAVAFELAGWSPDTNLPVLEINGVKIGVTICHDSYLGLLQRHLRDKGAQIWINPSYDNPVEEKWESILRLRAIELGIPALCTLHQNLNKRRRTHPFGFSPDGHELRSYPPGSPEDLRPLSECRDPGIYLLDIELNRGGVIKDLLFLPRTRKRHALLDSNGKLKIRLQGRVPFVFTGQSWTLVYDHVVAIGPVNTLVTLLINDQVLDIAHYIRALYKAYQENALPVFWNVWDRLPAKSEQMASVLLGRALESCAPIVLSDRESIYAVYELANQEKNLRWAIPPEVPCPEVAISLERAWGLRRSFAMVSDHLVGSQGHRLFQNALRRYLSLAT